MWGWDQGRGSPEGPGRTTADVCSPLRNCISELCVPLSLPEIKLLDVSKNNLEKVSPGFLTGCPKLETLNISVNKICECGGVRTPGLWDPNPRTTRLMSQSFFPQALYRISPPRSPP